MLKNSRGKREVENYDIRLKKKNLNGLKREFIVLLY